MNKTKEVCCEIQSSPICQKTYQIWVCEFYRNRKRNNGIFKCNACAKYDLAMSGQNGYILNKNVLFFSEIDSELKAYMLGIIAGDGSLYENHFRVVAHEDDTETLELFKNNISSDSCIGKYRNQRCRYIDIPSKRLSFDIRSILNINCGKKSDIISIPKFDEILTWHFIRGLMDSDGSINNLLISKSTNPHCSYASRIRRNKKSNQTTL